MVFSDWRAGHAKRVREASEIMSKKLVNSTDECVDEALSGLVACQPGLRLLQGHRVVVRADTQTLARDGKVTLLSGGGSGHEPAHTGYIGHAMLTAAVAGAVFASPPPASILAALRAIQSPAGTLMIVKNYTGDRLNFGIALERAKAEGLKVEMVIVGDDTALPSEGKLAGRRGLCGTILVHKIAGAASERGQSLAEVTALAQKIADNVATMSVSLSPCSVPGLKPSFSLKEDEMELGLGIHGEAGAERTELQPANKVVEVMLKHMIRDDPGYRYFKAEPGLEVALVVNNLGGTSNLELSIMTNAAIRYLVDVLQVVVVRVYTGSLMTSLEMAGVSLTLLKLSPEWLDYLDTQTSAPGWPSVTLGQNGSKTRLDPAPTPCQIASYVTSEEGAIKVPSTTIGKAMQSCVAEVCECLTSNEERLNDLDRGSGDGDCGTTLKAGSSAIKQRMDTINWDNPQQALLSLASLVECHMGGTSGAIYTLFLTAGATAEASWSEPASWATAMHNGLQAIMRYGGADRGHRTMIDALGPAVDVLVKGLPTAKVYQEALDVLKSAVQADSVGFVIFEPTLKEWGIAELGVNKNMKAAQVGAEGTVSMKAKAGRASYVHTSHLVNPDPGAQAVALWMEAIHNSLKIYI